MSVDVAVRGRPRDGRHCVRSSLAELHVGWLGADERGDVARRDQHTVDACPLELGDVVDGRIV